MNNEPDNTSDDAVNQQPVGAPPVPGETTEPSVDTSQESSSESQQINVQVEEQPEPTTEPAGEEQTSNESSSTFSSTSSTETTTVSSTETLAPAEPPAHTFGEQAVPIKEASSGKSKKLLITVVILVLAAAIVGAAWFLFSNSAKETDTNNSQQVAQPIDLVRVGSVDGPIGTEYLFPKPPGAVLSMEINFQVYEGLVGYENEKIVPLLATSWTNPDNNTWVFELKKDVTFQNGKPLTPQDVKTSLDALLKDEDWGAFISTVKQVVVTGDNQITIKTASPDSLLLNRLIYGFVYSQNADKTSSGTGAYTIDAANSKEENKTKLVAYDKYHGGKPMTKSVEYEIFEKDEDILKAVADNKIQIAKTATSETGTATNLKTVTYESPGMYGITFNMTKANTPLLKPEVREALLYAIDKSAFVKEAENKKTVSSYMLPKTVVGYDQTVKYPEFNQAKSKELLTKAGYPNGVTLTFNYIDKIQDDALILIKQLNSAGFKVVAKSYPSPREFVGATRSGNYDLFVATQTTDLGDGLDIFTNLLDSEGSQFPSLNNAEFDKKVNEAEAAFKPEEHVKKVQEINKYVLDNKYWLPIASTEESIHYPSTYDVQIDSYVGLGGIYFWKVGDFGSSNTTTQN
jgi:peptide/nickel transport system substrate-binding protein